MRGRVRIDLTGQEFERLRVLEFSHSGGGAAWWKCLCDPVLGGCGNETLAIGSQLRSGRHKSCGCLRREQLVARSTKHGHGGRTARSRTYNSWRQMIKRCTNPNHPRYADWGGRGITIDPRWLDFRNFLADMGERPAATTLNRRDNDGNYTRSNCNWADGHEQRINRRHWLTPERKREILDLRASGLYLDEISRRIGVSRSAISRALRAELSKP